MRKSIYYSYREVLFIVNQIIQRLMKYAIVDIETTGKTQRITEIAIVRYKDNQKLDEYVQLINPEQRLPYFITQLTGITDDMLLDAPTFKEVAQEIFERLNGYVFVAHHVNFDLPIVTKHLAACGITFKPKKMCTVRLSRQLIPGKQSYSLGKLCKDLGINIHGRHRALGDALATGRIWELFYDNPNFQEVFEKALKPTKGVNALPANLPLKDFEKLPETPGVYYFLNKKMEILYIGKAINLKKRVLTHFRSKSKSKITMCRETAHLDFVESGTELLALIMENLAIKKHWPRYNRASKNFSPRLGITSFKNRKGITQLGFNQLRLISQPIAEFHSEGECIKFLTELCMDYNLCPKYCQLVGASARCEDYYLHIPCDYCQEEIDEVEYNKRVQTAIESTHSDLKTEIIELAGRNVEESSFVWIEKGLFRGYGFLPKEESVQTLEDLEKFLVTEKSNPEIQGMLNRFLTDKYNTFTFPTMHQAN
ncbi:DNA polymerase III subunit epsilon [Flavobacteriaceae bacterium Ap0902]|nr:DNA polymerase III subunit epsilon [Flavobacteriaceae bacterium Ap0902]